MRYFPIIFLGGFAIELASLIWVGSRIGVIATILLVLLAGMAGMAVIRRTGMDLGSAFRRAGGPGTIASADAGAVFLRMLAGLLLLIPGFVSDLVALVMLLPPVTAALSRRFFTAVDMQFGAPPGRRDGQGPIIEGEVVEIGGEVAGPAERDRRP